MLDWGAQAPAITKAVDPHKLTEPLLYLSSAETGWEDVSVEAFYEPSELEGWPTPATSAISLVLFTGGPLRVEVRGASGSWYGATLHHGEFVLNGSMGRAAEVRWRSLSAVPTQTLHLHLRRELVLQAVETVTTGVPPEHLPMARRAGFHDPLLTQVALALRQELEQPKPAGNAFAHSAAQLLALHLARAYTGGSAQETAAALVPGGLSERQTEQVFEYIQRHLCEDLSVETLARHVGFSPYHFARLFRQTMGVSPHQFVVRQRLERAQWLLQQTELPLAQVARACGFADQSHLTQVFKQQMGCTPRAYRRRDTGCVRSG